MTRLILALTLLAAPVAAWAECRAPGEDQAMSCAQGTIWDPDAGACVPIVIG